VPTFLALRYRMRNGSEFGVVRGCRTFVPMMKAQGSGHLVNTASLAGLVHPPATASYTAVIKGIDRRQMVIVPDAPARKAVWTQRFARPLYDREQRRFADRIHALTKDSA